MAWFRMRRKSSALQMTREHVKKVVDTAHDLDAVLAAALKGDRGEITGAFSRLDMDERAADNVEIALVEELSRGELSAKDREDLMRLVTAVDTVADWLKVAGKNVDILTETGITIPPEIWSMFKEMSKTVVDECKALQSMVEVFDRDYKATVKFRDDVKKLERLVDEMYFESKKVLVKIYTSLGIVTILNDLLEGIENAADFCKHSADMLLTLAISGR